MKLSKTQVKIIAMTLGVVVSFSIYSYLFTTIKNKNNQISALQNKVNIEVRKDQQLHSIKQLVADLHKEFEKIDTYFISEDGVVDFLEELETLGTTANVSVGVNSVSVDENTNKGLTYELLKVEFIARGGWDSIIQMISLFETFPFGITIERMQLERVPSSTSWQVSTSFTVLKLK